MSNSKAMHRNVPSLPKMSNGLRIPVQTKIREAVMDKIVENNFCW